MPGPERITYIPVPDYLLVEIKPVEFPSESTYGEVLKGCGKDRDSLQVVNGQLRAIRALEAESD